MIKSIHYIWLGSVLPNRNMAIVDEWIELMPDFKFYFWNETNIRNYNSIFLKQCLRKKAFAFAADYIRLNVVNDYGGFYLDTDMKLIKPLNIDGNIQFQICAEVENRPSWGYFYSTPNNPILIDCLKKYDNFYFDQFKPPVIPYFLKDIVLLYRDNLRILPAEYFYPLPMDENPEKWNDYISSKTIGVHLWDFSWGKLKKVDSVGIEVIYRLKVLISDFFTFTYPMHYFRINLVRIVRLIKAG